MVISVDDQRLVLMKEGAPVKSYPVSTSKFGLGSRPNSKKTPLGNMVVAEKIGAGARPGTVFKGRKPTGEVIRPNAPGRDPIVSRILWLEGLERSNSNTKERYIYIHGTPEERNIGRPASYGCIRMTSRDVIDLYERVGVGTQLHVKRSPLRTGEIPTRDRLEIAATRARTGGPSLSPSPAPAPPRGRPEIERMNSGTELLAAAEPQRVRPIAPAPAPRRAPVATRPAKPPVPSQEPPRRRGAFTRASAPEARAVSPQPVRSSSSGAVASRSR